MLCLGNACSNSCLWEIPCAVSWRAGLCPHCTVNSIPKQIEKKLGWWEGRSCMLCEDLWKGSGPTILILAFLGTPRSLPVAGCRKHPVRLSDRVWAYAVCILWCNEQSLLLSAPKPMLWGYSLFCQHWPVIRIVEQNSKPENIQNETWFHSLSGWISGRCLLWLVYYS